MSVVHIVLSLLEKWLFTVICAFSIFQILRVLKKRKDLSNCVSPSCQSVVLADVEEVHGSVYANVDPDPSVQTAYDVFFRGHGISEKHGCLGYRSNADCSYDWISYGQVFCDAHNVGWYLMKNEIVSGKPVAIYSVNRPEWTVSAIALCSQSIPVLPLYDTFGKDSIIEIVRRADVSTFFCDTLERLKTMIQAKQAGAVCLKTAVLFDYNKEEVDVFQATLRENNITVYSYRSLTATASTTDAPSLRLPKPDDIFLICHTSGSTGSPKGVVISHRNFVSSVKNTLSILYQQRVTTSRDECIISYLPMAHIYEQLNQGAAMFSGMKIGFYSGKVSLLAEDLKALRPHWLPTVPRMLNRIHDEVTKRIQANLWANVLFWFAVRFKLVQASLGFRWRNEIVDRLVFRKVQNMFGGRLRLCALGSAPMNPITLNQCRAMLGCPIMEGYGQTESTGPITVSMLADNSSGHVGALVPNILVKLIDVPELNYYSCNGQGEICVKGPIVSPGYYVHGKIVADHLDSDGWLQTGDIGQWLPNGAMKLIDRRKYIFKLSQGEFVFPERIENVCLRSPWISQIYVDANSEESYLVAVVVPDRQLLSQWSKAKTTISDEDFETLCNSQLLKNTILDSLQDLCRRENLNSLEIVKNIQLSPIAFSVENGLLTPTMKNCRHELRNAYKSTIDAMYDRQR